MLFAAAGGGGVAGRMVAFPSWERVPALPTFGRQSLLGVLVAAAGSVRRCRDIV